MVNELNKPQDNSALSELLAASNRQLQEMQEEHRQLQEELSRLSVQRQQLRQATREHHSQVTSSSTSTVVSSSGSQIASESLSATDEAAAVQQTDAASAVGEEEDNEETANYLQEKLAEIANLKAQFKRVQNITDSTKLIEQHLSSVESQSSSTVMKSKQTKTMESIQSSSSTSSTSRSAQSLEAATSATSATSEARATPDNAELLNAMINMVTDFTSDLRGQEESLRAERLRIKSLKEEIIQRKQSKE
ncbi:uncharacterized protein LOC132790105 [Drosophila nasuta]|uniref:uncharacterized protein LOC132790105 n=1 Tax=Drosophila nasuta TaxID=42062 RepID=UPI00295EF47C|nr:uncharacterized protein LOC132790105 [Drosophila nasuta]